MPLRIEEFGVVLRRLFRALRWASFGIIGVVVVLLAFRVAEVTAFLAGIHPLLGAAFLLTLFLALAWFVGRPLYQFLRVPPVMRPPKLPPPDERKPADLARHLAYVEAYVEALPANPEWEGDPRLVAETAEACRVLAAEARDADAPALAELVARARAVEQDRVARLLEPLDRKTADAIRAEAFRIGVATAVSPYGTLDAFLVLWRNCNLTARIARIYYGRPTPRGTLQILRDVSLATIAGAYLEDLGEIAGEFVGSLAGKTAGFFAGPLMEGCLNGVATLRVGYLARTRCRAFQAWNERTAARAAREALVEAGRHSAGLVGDVVRTVGAGIMGIPAKALAGLVDRMTGIFRRRQEEAPSG